MSNQRKRVTITIREDLLQGLDKMIDHQGVRNRSHAIEVLLTRSLQTKTTQAVILASGEGVKMRPFTYEVPKPLIPVNGKPILEHTIELLRSHGVTNIIMTVSHLADRIEKHFGDGSKFGVSITYVHEKKPTGTGGALLAAQKKLNSSPFLMIYADLLLEFNVNDLLQAHRATKAAAGTIALTSVADPSAFGAVKLHGTRVVEFSEKPVISDATSRLVFAGMAAFDSAVFNFLPKKSRGILSLENDVFPKLIADGRLHGFPFEGQWFDVSTPEVYEQVLKQWKI